MVRKVSVRDIIPLRHKILRPGKPIETAYFEGDDEDTTVHLAFLDEMGNVIGCATFLQRPFPGEGKYQGENSYQVRGMAVDETHQGKGIGGKLLLEGLRIVSERKVSLVWCNARIEAVKFYEKFGFKTIGEAFTIPEVGEHYRMVKEMKDVAPTGL